MSFALRVAIAGEPWALAPHAVAATTATLSGGGARRVASTPPARMPATAALGVALLQLDGVILPGEFEAQRYRDRASALSTFREQLGEAVRDPEIRAIVVAVDSPGGIVGRIADAADELIAARAQKRVIAHVEGEASGSALWIASQAGQVFATRGSRIGGIGVTGALVDSSRAALADGVDVLIVKSGAFKGGHIPGARVEQPAIDDAARVIQDVAALMIGDIARGRGRDVATIAQLANGRLWTAADAAALGLIDGVRSRDRVISALATSMRTDALRELQSNGKR